MGVAVSRPGAVGPGGSSAGRRADHQADHEQDGEEAHDERERGEVTGLR